jgi:hypothetical protein
MTIYAKSWCPAYPCDPCLVQPPNQTQDNIGSSGNLVVYNYHEGDTSYFLGVRKWGLIIDTVAGSFGLPQTDPPQFCMVVNGKTAVRGGPAVPLSDLTLTYGGSIVFTVSGPIHVMTTSPVGSDGLYGFSGYIEVPADNIIHLGPGASAWEWHYDGPFQPGPVTLKWDISTDGTSYSNYEPEVSGLTFYRTSCQEMLLSLTRQRRRVRLVGRYV